MNGDHTHTLPSDTLFESSGSRSVVGIKVSGAVRLSLFFGTLISALILTDWLIDRGMRQIDTGAYGVFNRIVDGRINAAVLVTGSSRALNHYDTRRVQQVTGASAWNIGVNGSQTDMQLAVLRAYLRHNVAPSLLIHNLDSFAFVSSRHGLAFPEYYVPYLSERPIYDTLNRLDADWWKARYLPLYGYAVHDMRLSWMLGFAALVGRQPAETRVQGFEPRFARWNEDFERFRTANPQGVSFTVEADAVIDFEALIAEASARRTRVLLVYSPVYIKMQELDRSRRDVFARFSEIARRHDAIVWDYSDSAISRRRELFYNSQHLNAQGAALFSESLARRLVDSKLLEHMRGEMVAR